MKSETPVRPITIFHLIIGVVAYLIGDGIARLLNAYVLPRPVDWLPFPFGLIAVIVLLRPFLSLLRRALRRRVKKNSEMKARRT
jgi:hypothetical protein